MDHIAILNKSWNLLGKILSGEKTIESRWYKFRRAPWNKIFAGETVYFKNSGEQITVRAKVDKVLQFSDLSEQKVKEILDLYHLQIGIPENKVSEFVAQFRNKKYCILVFLKSVQKIVPFEISKKGFGVMSAWLCVDDIEEIKIE
ncbi:hypothetical protein HY485_00915 [Candidatus Woesearchaeota archaeon]|nr:hypothetical protein [Candidatus Woesearchaeota archaeon]